MGDTVRAGAVVARLTPLPLDARSRAQAEATLAAAREHERAMTTAVEEARIALDGTERDRRRAERLLAGGVIAQVDLERLQLLEAGRRREVEGAEARARAAGYDVRAAQAALHAAGTGRTAETLLLRAAIDGTVLTIPERSQRTVQPGEPLLEIGNPADLEVVVDLLSTDAVQVRAGQRMLLSGWGRDTTLAATVRRVEPAGFTKISALGVEEQRVNVIGDLTQPPSGLGDRFRVAVEIVIWEQDSVLKIPNSALFRSGTSWAVFVVEGGRARQRIVTIGHESASEAEVVSGLAAGDTVIRHPTDRIEDGIRVRYQP